MPSNKNGISDIAKKDYIESVESTVAETATAETSIAVKEREEATVASLIEACCQMAIPVHIRLPLSNIGDGSFIEKVGGYNVLTTTANYASPLQFALKRVMDVLEVWLAA